MNEEPFAGMIVQQALSWVTAFLGIAGFLFVCLTYKREATEGLLGTGIPPLPPTLLSIVLTLAPFIAL